MRYIAYVAIDPERTYITTLYPEKVNSGPLQYFISPLIGQPPLSIQTSGGSITASSLASKLRVF